jgi:hypothetical protein
VQRRIARARSEERRLAEEPGTAQACTANEEADRESRPSHQSGIAPASRGINIRERLEHEALHSKDSRSRIAALKELHELEKQCAGQESATVHLSMYALRVGTLIVEPEKWRSDYDSERPTFRLMCRVRSGIEHVVDGVAPGQVLQCLGIGLRVWTPEQLDAAEAALRPHHLAPSLTETHPEPEYMPLTEAEIAELDERIAGERSARRSRLAGRICDLRRQAAAAEAP